MSYNEERKGYETKDGGLIRISGDDRVRIDIYDGDERVKGGHTRDTINYDTNTGRGRIDSHNADKSEKSSTVEQSNEAKFIENKLLQWENIQDIDFALFDSKEDKSKYFKL